MEDILLIFSQLDASAQAACLKGTLEVLYDDIECDFITHILLVKKILSYSRKRFNEF